MAFDHACQVDRFRTLSSRSRCSAADSAEGDVGVETIIGRPQPRRADALDHGGLEPFQAGDQARLADPGEQDAGVSRVWERAERQNIEVE
jgi:hypothetical protein